MKVATDDAMGEALAVVRSYDELHAALRARVDTLGISLDTLDDLCGFWPGYASHILGPKPQGSIRMFKRLSLDCVLGALALKIVVVEDRDALAKVRGRLVASDKAQSRRRNAEPASIKPPENAFVMLARAGGFARAANLSAKRRVAIARRAARARWQAR
jgi:hypothetical protein